MPTPALYVIVGPNGAGKTTYFEKVLGPVTGLPFINADVIALREWPQDPESNSYRAAALAAEQRAAALEARRSFVAETVFSHPSKLDLLRNAKSLGFLVFLHVVAIPEELAVQRVAVRVRVGGHAVPEVKIRQRFRRLWHLVRIGCEVADEALVFDNSQASQPYRRVMRFHGGSSRQLRELPSWFPPELMALPGAHGRFELEEKA